VKTPPPHLDVRLTDADRSTALAADVRAGLTAERKLVPSKWLYDDRGSDLFEEITLLPEYYPTRAERSILEAHANDIARASGAATLVELGSGASLKTRLLLDALGRAGTLRSFVAFDVAEGMLRQSLATLGDDYPAIAMAGVVGDFEVHLDDLPASDKRLVAFLGGTVGNLEPSSRKAFFATVAGQLHEGEGLLLGTDLVKAPERMIAAYDDPAGVTEAFEKNVLSVINTALHADFDADAFAYRAVWSEVEERIEMGVVSRGAQRVRIADLDLVVDLADGEEIRTEVSAKFHLDRIGDEMHGAGLEPVASWTDPAGDFGLTLARRTA
jgi:L-histidine N-alpha-methyltransferase